MDNLYINIKKLILTAVILITGFTILPGQDLTFFSQYNNNRLAINPAFAGDRETPGLSILSRQQWVSWEGSPSSNILTAHTLVKDKNMGLGTILKYDRIGPVTITGISGIYSYTVALSETSRLLMGLQGELNIIQNRLDQLKLVDQDDQLFMVDPGIVFRPNAGFGFCYVNGNYDLQFSVPGLFNTSISSTTGESSNLAKLQRTYYLGSSADFNVTKDILLDVSLLIGLTRGASPYLELAPLLWLKKKTGFGVLYRLNNTFGAMIMYRYEDLFEFGYSYDLALGLLGFNTGTHEIFLAYKLPFNRIEILSPRRF